ncbi:MAG: hypothetical protein B7X86_11230 [Sphingobacteriales bacterium 17-39-43]|uniref:DUF3098 domain-containing protein n=1 Tax=Daejeonella sp. TaxID=2805397 RepID=UPI000BCD7CED|nr:DUF3098 domain-containing protein [Daejeonella sp.]OYY02310.1 MAG: hypothetical protein B7Y76_05790 [Sphingobacteriia bacterium 35-40-5]OYZ30954.1 MAG: hypothetical protein B7Y24_10915 [Sphingobacteriales bacterium 16-39-50]OZA23819.1 MAG: hypothetical protein B7X86_11230 [Sphingobacteriales bacterium 17-39-43]HQS04662.1 DUF3098 domain-containing protein [Daejeonella sp.]HQT22795.1 DUF3098 domain-containing protein [Daejeonella sp.]
MAQKNTPIKESPQEGFVFGKNNYRLMLLSIIVVLFGFMLMIGDTDIYEFRKIVLAPIIVLAGFAIGFIAILKK